VTKPEHTCSMHPLGAQTTGPCQACQMTHESRIMARPCAENPFRNWDADSGLENGNYHCTCMTCQLSFIGHKRRVISKACADKFNDAAKAKDARIAVLEAALRQVVEECLWFGSYEEMSLIIEKLAKTALAKDPSALPPSDCATRSSFRAQVRLEFAYEFCAYCESGKYQFTYSGFLQELRRMAGEVKP
jgi:hypothetical protein